MAESKPRGAGRIDATPAGPAPSRAAQGFLSGAEREFTRRDFLSRSSMAGLVVAAGGIFLAGRAEAAVSPRAATRALPPGPPPFRPEGHPAAARLPGAGAKGGFRVAQHCSHGSHGSHGSHASHGSHGSHGSHASW